MSVCAARMRNDKDFHLTKPNYVGAKLCHLTSEVAYKNITVPETNDEINIVVFHASIDPFECVWMSWVEHCFTSFSFCLQDQPVVCGCRDADGNIMVFIVVFGGVVTWHTVVNSIGCVADNDALE